MGSPDFQHPRARALSITSSESPLSISMDSIAQLIGYPESDFEAESDPELETPRAAPSHGNGHSLDTSNPLVNRSQPSMGYPRDSDGRKVVDKPEHQSANLQRGRASLSTTSIENASPRKRKRRSLPNYLNEVKMQFRLTYFYMQMISYTSPHLTKRTMQLVTIIMKQPPTIGMTNQYMQYRSGRSNPRLVRLNMSQPEDYKKTLFNHLQRHHNLRQQRHQPKGSKKVN